MCIRISRTLYVRTYVRVHTYMHMCVLLIFIAAVLCCGARQAASDSSIATASCPLGLAYDNLTHTCVCRDDLGSHLLKCDPHTKQLMVLVGACLTYDRKLQGPVVGYCPVYPYWMNFTDYNYYVFPALPEHTAESDLTAVMCGALNKTGRLCGECVNGTGPAPYTRDLQCLECLQHGSAWLLYLALQIAPLTAFLLITLLLGLNFTSPAMNAFVIYAQFYSQTVTFRYPNSRYNYSRNHWLTTALLAQSTFYDMFNLQFFQSLLPPFCMSDEMSYLQAFALNYIPAFYPLVFIALAYLFIVVRDRRYIHKELSCCDVLHPLAKCCSLLTRAVSFKKSLIETFASFFLLAFLKINLTTAYPLFVTSLRTLNGTAIKSVVYLQGTLDLAEDAFQIAVSAVTIVLFGLMPLLLMLVYPTRTFQKCLNCCGLRCLPLHIFMDAFQGCYKNGTEGTRDYRFFSAVYLLLRLIFLLEVQAKTFNWWPSGSNRVVTFAALSLSFALLQPYKKRWYNILDSLFFACGALIEFIGTTCSGLSRLRYSVPVGVITLVLQTLPSLYLLLYLSHYLLFKTRLQHTKVAQWMAKLFAWKRSSDNNNMDCTRDALLNIQ